MLLTLVVTLLPASPARLFGDAVLAAAALVMLALLAARFTRNLRDLARLEPPITPGRGVPARAGTPRATSLA